MKDFVEKPWSFSRLNCYQTCPRKYKKQYIDKEQQENNAFAEFGLVCHEALEFYGKEILEASDLLYFYLARYSHYVKTPFPPYPKNMEKTYFEKGIKYFKNFEGYGNCEILGVEDEFVIDVDGYKVGGFLDLSLIKDRKLQVWDHKTISSVSMKKSLSEYKHQLYVYAMYIFEKMGRYPDVLALNLLKEDKLVPFDFDEAELNLTKKWICDTIDSIMLDEDFEPVDNGYFCKFICGVRNGCPYVKR